MRGLTASARGISRRLRLHPWRRTALPPASLIAWRSGGIVIEAFRAFAHDAAADETLERTQRPVIFRRDETDRVADRMRAAGAADAMDVILRVHREIVIHHVRNAVHVDAARRDIRGHEHAHRAGLEILQRAQPLVLRTVRMERAGLDAAAFEPARDAVGAVLGAGENEHGVELRIAPADGASSAGFRCDRTS